MIIVCHKSFDDLNGFEGEYFKHFLVERHIKATVSDEVWSAFRFRVQQKNPTHYDKIIVNVRGIIKPENVKLDSNFEEITPIDYDDNFLHGSTINLIKRNWAEVDTFICNCPEKYTSINGVKILSIEAWFASKMNDELLRDSIERFSRQYAYKKYEVE